MDFKLIGSILLIVGTSIGAGMLALPIATAELGFIGSVILLVSCWLVMTLGAFLLLEANLWLPHRSNIISMARETIGPFGQLIAWITYLLLLYSLLCAYIAGGSDLFHNLFLRQGIEFSAYLSAILFVFIFGNVVYFGIRSVDYTNRGLMILKFTSYFILIFLLAPVVSSENLQQSNLTYLTSLSAITVTITSFGYATIIPSLRVYFLGDLRKLKLAILIGSLIPLICYIAWDAAIMGVLPITGDNGLQQIANSSNSTSGLVNSLTNITADTSIKFFVQLFTSICVLTSFLGAALCLSDFLADGMNLERKGMEGIYVHLLTFLPPLAIVLFFPNMFIKALEYAGIYCVILLILLPAWMVYQGRYIKNFTSEFKVKGGKILLIILIILSMMLIIKSVGNFIPFF